MVEAHATPLPGPATSLAGDGGDAQTGDLGTPLAGPLAIRVTDRYGNLVPGFMVAWSVEAGGGSITPASVTTSALGRAEAAWVLGDRLDVVHTATASGGSLPVVRFTATPRLPAGATVSRDGDSPLTAVAGSAIAEPIAVRVRLADGHPVRGASVAWTTGSGSGTVSDATSITDEEGRALTRWTLGTSSGSQSLTVTATGIAPLSITATALVGAPASVAIISGNGQSATVGTVLPDPLVVRVTDQYGNPTPNTRIEWTVLQGGGSVSTSVSTTDATGRANAQWALGPVEGENRLTASVGTAVATYSATARAGSGEVAITMRVIASGLSAPLYLTTTPIDDRLFVVEQTGRIRVISDGVLLPTAFLDLSSKVSCCGERGLLSVAFHPRYATNGFFYVFYTDAAGDLRVERYTVSANADIGDPTSAALILSVPHRAYGNHNGGLVAFGGDGMLYVGTGDGGSGGDPDNNGQNLGVLLGKLLRIDVDHGDPYSIPSDNPFASRAGARGEIWAYGLRNPWRWSFDAATHRLYVADVGQGAHEEVNAVGAADAGLNYGWRIMEGASCYEAASCDRSGLQLPVVDYDHTQGCSVTGGYVYRGAEIPEIRGHYFYSDFCGSWLRSFRLVGGAATDQKQWPVGDLGDVASFGVDRRGELYIMANGRVMKIVRGS
jgi:glucose/arabinose dehydrogenase